MFGVPYLRCALFLPTNPFPWCCISTFEMQKRSVAVCQTCWGQTLIERSLFRWTGECLCWRRKTELISDSGNRFASFNPFAASSSLSPAERYEAEYMGASEFLVVRFSTGYAKALTRSCRWICCSCHWWSGAPLRQAILCTIPSQTGEGVHLCPGTSRGGYGRGALWINPSLC